jgi:hypothetical protein
MCFLYKSGRQHILKLKKGSIVIGGERYVRHFKAGYERIF